MSKESNELIKNIESRFVGKFAWLIKKGSRVSFFNHILTEHLGKLDIKNNKDNIWFASDSWKQYLNNNIKYKNDFETKKGNVLNVLAKVLIEETSLLQKDTDNEDGKIKWWNTLRDYILANNHPREVEAYYGEELYREKIYSIKKIADDIEEIRNKLIKIKVKTKVLVFNYLRRPAGYKEKEIEVLVKK